MKTDIDELIKFINAAIDEYEADREEEIRESQREAFIESKVASLARANFYEGCLHICRWFKNYLEGLKKKS